MYLGTDEWVQIDTIPVDSGQVCISDPCYSRDYDQDVLPVALTAIQDQETVYNVNGDTVVACTPHGDGMYPVYVKYNERGQVIALMVTLDWDEDNGEEKRGL